MIPPPAPPTAHQHHEKNAPFSTTSPGKYNPVVHKNFREYFGDHRKHQKLADMVAESDAALVRASLATLGRSASTPPTRRRPQSRGSGSPGGSPKHALTDGTVGSQSLGTMYNTEEWLRAVVRTNVVKERGTRRRYTGSREGGRQGGGVVYGVWWQRAMFEGDEDGLLGTEFRSHEIHPTFTLTT